MKHAVVRSNVLSPDEKTTRRSSCHRALTTVYAVTRCLDLWPRGSTWAVMDDDAPSIYTWWKIFPRLMRAVMESQTPFTPPHLNKAVFSNKMHSAFLQVMFNGSVLELCSVGDTHTHTQNAVIQVFRFQGLFTQTHSTSGSTPLCVHSERSPCEYPVNDDYTLRMQICFLMGFFLHSVILIGSCSCPNWLMICIYLLG